MNNKTDIEEDIKILKEIDIKFFLSGIIEQSSYITDTADRVNKAIENILADRERLEKENKELKGKINKKDKIIETMRYIKNTSKYEDTILIDEDRVNCVRRNKFLIETNSGEFVEVNNLKAKANKYDSLVEKIKKDIEEYPEVTYTKYYLLDCLGLLKGE